MKRFRKSAEPSSAQDVRAATILAAPPSVIPPIFGATFFAWFLLVLLLGGMFGCLITGFSLPVSQTMLWLGIPFLSFVLLLWTLLSQAVPLLGIVLPGLMALYAWFRFDVLTTGLTYIAAAVMRFLCKGFPGLQIPRALSEHAQFLEYAETNTLLLSGISAPITEAILCFCVVIGLIWILLYQKLQQVWLSAALPLPIFILCFLIIETTLPSHFTLLLILLYWILLLFTRTAFHLHMRAASSQALFLVLPCVLFLIAVYLWYPQNTSVGSMVQSGYDRVIDALASLESTVSGTAGKLFSGGWLSVSAEGDEIAFDNLGPRRYFGRTVMRAKSDTAGVIYLRENTYSSYTEDGWSQTDFSYLDLPSSNPAYASYSAEVLAASGFSSCRLSLDGARSDLLFSPYYFSDASVPYTVVGDARIQNDDRNADYDISFYRFPGEFEALTTHPDAAEHNLDMRKYQTFLHNSIYCEIDDALAAELRSILSDNGIRTDSAYTAFTFENGGIATLTDYDAVWDMVADITYFVRGCAQYSLDAEPNPTDRNFVLWFLEDAEYGYCTHFATAEVMLLRACGIPARLAAGYLADVVNANTWTAIKDSNAHAWAEVYDDRLGWVPVEATPPSELSAHTDPDAVIVGVTPIRVDTPDDSVTTDEPSEQTTAEPAQTEPPTTQTTPADTEPSTPTTSPTDPDHPSDTNDPNSGNPGTPPSDKPRLPKNFGKCLLGLLAVGLILTVPYLVRQTRRRTITAWFTPDEKERNACALKLYRRCDALARAVNEELPASLTALAEKARFSHHTLTEEELSLMVAWYQSRCAHLKAQDKMLSRLRHFWLDSYY